MKRLLALISHQAQLIAENTAIKQQAESASRAASALLDASAPPRERRKSEQGSGDVESKDKQKAELERQLLSKNDELEEANKSLHTARVDLDAMKRQAKSVSDEYDNLLKEHAKVLARLEKFESDTGLSGSEAKKHN